jgi:hypothetical protein
VATLILVATFLFLRKLQGRSFSSSLFPKEGKGIDLPFRTFLNADCPCIPLERKYQANTLQSPYVRYGVLCGALRRSPVSYGARTAPVRCLVRSPVRTSGGVVRTAPGPYRTYGAPPSALAPLPSRAPSLDHRSLVVADLLLFFLKLPRGPIETITKNSTMKPPTEIAVLTSPPPLSPTNHRQGATGDDRSIVPTLKPRFHLFLPSPTRRPRHRHRAAAAAAAGAVVSCYPPSPPSPPATATDATLSPPRYLNLRA